MKKLIGALALTAMIATSAFAEVSFGAWICNLFVPMFYNGDTVQSGGSTNPWGYGVRPARLNAAWTADDGKAGMNADFYLNSGSVDQGDQANIWLRPVEAFKVTFGYLDNYTNERGDLAFGSWNWLRPTSAWLAEDEGLTFSGIGGLNFAIELYPVDALHIWLNMPAAAGKMQKATTAFGNSAVGASFKIGDFAKIKAQFLGQYSATDKAADAEIGAGKIYGYVDGVLTEFDAYEDAFKAGATGIGYTEDGLEAGEASSYKRYGTIEAAFDLVGIDRLFLTLGGAFTIADSDYWAANGGYMAKVALGASFGITETLKFSANVAGFFAHSDAPVSDPAIQFGLGLDFGITEKLAATVDFRALIPTASSVDPTFAFMLGGTYAIGSNGSLGLGVQGIINKGESAQFSNGALALDGGKFGIAVPIRMQIAF